MKYTKEAFEYVLSLIEEYNLYSYKELVLKYNELTGSNESITTIRGMMNYYGFSMKKHRTNKVLELRKVGFSNQQIADIVGLNKESVSRIGVSLNNKRFKRRKRDFWKEKSFKNRVIGLLEWYDYNLSKVAKSVRMRFSDLVEVLKYHKIYDLWRTNAKIKDGSKTRKCIEYFKMYPNASAYKIAEIVGCDYKVAWKARKKLKEESIIWKHKNVTILKTKLNKETLWRQLWKRH